MNISNSTGSFANQSLVSNRPAHGPPPPRPEEELSSALSAIGVDDDKAAEILGQVQEAVDAIQSGSTDRSANGELIRNAIDEVLEANGVDSAEVGASINANRPSGPPPHGPPPGRGESTSVESALAAANVTEEDIEALLNELVDTISELTSDSTQETSSEDIEAALTDVLEENGVDVELFRQALGGQLGGNGKFVNRFV